MQGINPKILIWAREQSGFSLDDIAKYFRKEPQFIQDWEDGASSPSFPQLEKLANKYKRPTALFFFPKAPQENPISQSFRTLPEQEASYIQPSLRYIIRKAKVMQMNLFELNNGVNPAKKILLHSIDVSNKSIDDVANELRLLIGINLEKQKTYKRPEVAFKAWRNALEKYGIFVFKDAFKDEGFSGFCLYDNIFPIIYINNSLPPSRQVFTLFHELAHLLFGIDGIEMLSSNQDYPNKLSETDKRIEVFCNAFSGKFLVPDEAFKHYLNSQINDTTLANIANKFAVSREVILRKFLDNQKITANFYAQQVKEWKNSFNEQKNNKKLGGNSDYTKRVYLGETYMETAFSQYYNNNISTQQLADYLDIKPWRIPKMESLIFEEGGRL
ncbi:helix-turn-helix domain-containing protein [Candidatus Thiodubiliella endoseptemdiera]|uniref:helix-turn-helix domain-containing protein n=1 Tax=Candidatus Thiodubiliella endoseptemdiera TaxID=2738886 RepID=UPI0034DFC98A